MALYGLLGSDVNEEGVRRLQEELEWVVGQAIGVCSGGEGEHKLGCEEGDVIGK